MLIQNHEHLLLQAILLVKVKKPQTPLFFCLFLKKESVHVHEWEEGSGREKERILSGLHVQWGARCRTQSYKPEIMT